MRLDCFEKEIWFYLGCLGFVHADSLSCMTVSQMSNLRLRNYGKMPVVFTTPIIKAVLHSNTLYVNFSQMGNSRKEFLMHTRHHRCR